jgi:transposase InsO family protein
MRSLAYPADRIALPDAWPARVKSGLVHAVSLAHFGITHIRGWCADSRIARVRLAADNDRLTCENRLLEEELRIKDARMAKIPALERPHYAPTDRLAILALKGARRWSNPQAERKFLVTALTIATWMQRVDDDGPDALVRVPEPVNRFPDLVTHLVQRLKTLCPAMGKTRIAQVLARAGLHLSASTARRMLKARPVPAPQDEGPEPVDGAERASARTVTARYPDHVWNLDLTVVPTNLGLWVPWLPFCIAQCWPFTWHLAVIIDHFSRAIVGLGLFRKSPSGAQICEVLEHAVHIAGRPPKYTVSDQGPQFRGDFRDWCKRRGVKPRFGAIGKHGSIAVTERAIRTIKDEGVRPTVVPLGVGAMWRHIALYACWYNELRPHRWLGGATPIEVYLGLDRAHDKARFEPRARYPARRGEKIRARRGAKLRLQVTHLDGHKHLPIVALKAA